MNFALFRHRQIWWPTWVGWICLLTLIILPVLWWSICGENYLAKTKRLPADILIVEGWIGLDGLSAAKAEFEQYHYHFVVTSGGLHMDHWSNRRTNYAMDAAAILKELGISSSRIIEAPATNSANHRTFEAAAAVRQAVEQRGLHPQSVDVFTFGVHARRSRLVFAKAFQPSIEVGVVSWMPAHSLDGPWWRSSERALDFLKETVGYFFELFLNSGRLSHHVPKAGKMTP